MSKGIIYIMTTIVDGLIKIGKTQTDQFERRMYILEHNGYQNVTGLKRAFGIEVDEYDEKEVLLHTIFGKSRVGNTELFSVDVSTAIQLLSSFDGDIIYPKGEAKSAIFTTATEARMSRYIPDGEYYYKKSKKSDGRQVNAIAAIKDGKWTIKKDSILGVNEDVGVSKKTKAVRATISLAEDGRLLEDLYLGDCTPSSAGEIVVNQSSNGWLEWTTKTGEPIDVFRTKQEDEE